MNLELTEEKALIYLQQVTNPLVPIERLLSHLRQEDELSGLERTELLGFFGDHELFTVLETPGIGQDAAVAAALEESSLAAGICVILRTRIPSKKDMGEMMVLQLEMLKDALLKASDSASADKQAEIQAALEKTDAMCKKIASL